MRRNASFSSSATMLAALHVLRRLAGLVENVLEVLLGMGPLLLQLLPLVAQLGLGKVHLHAQLVTLGLEFLNQFFEAVVRHELLLVGHE